MNLHRTLSLGTDWLIDWLIDKIVCLHKLTSYNNDETVIGYMMKISRTMRPYNNNIEIIYHVSKALPFAKYAKSTDFKLCFQIRVLTIRLKPSVLFACTATSPHWTHMLPIFSKRINNRNSTAAGVYRLSGPRHILLVYNQFAPFRCSCQVDNRFAARCKPCWDLAHSSAKWPRSRVST